MRRLLDDLLDGGHVLCADAYVAEEARRNLATKAPAGLAALARLLDRLELMPLQADPAAMAGLSDLPEKDRPVVAAAVRMGCGALLTGGRAHFGRCYEQSLAGVAIHSPRSLAALLL